MSTSLFSSNSGDILEKEFVKHDIFISNWMSFYEIENCIQFIKDGDHKKVALQFPDELLNDSSKIVLKLQSSTNSTVFILGDTSYGSCCIDEVAAQHSNADCVIHFGRSCLSPTGRLPVLHIFGEYTIDLRHCLEAMKVILQDVKCSVIVVYDTIYHHCIANIHSVTIEDVTYDNIILSCLNIPSNTDKNVGMLPIMKMDQSKKITRCGRTFYLPDKTSLESCIMFYIGSEGQTLSNLMMNFSQNRFYSYDPVKKLVRFEEINVNKALMKRFYMIERTKDANIIGIVIGTLGVLNYMDIMKRIKLLLKNAGKKFYTFVVGKLNVAKLANFLEVDVFVLVSCSENTLIDSKEFYKPIITPYELEIACNTQREWSTEYITDFAELLQNSESLAPINSSENNSSVDVSLVSNQIRYIGKPESSAVNTLDVLPAAGKAITVHRSAGDYLSTRSWRGLEQNLGETPVKKADEGQTGIAAKYTKEPVI